MINNLNQPLADYLAARNANTRAWVNESPGRCAGYLVEDLDFWREFGITTTEQFVRYDLISSISDLHKEIYGVRNRGSYEALGGTPIWELEDIAKSLHRQLAAEIDREAAAKIRTAELERAALEKEKALAVPQYEDFGSSVLPSNF